MTDWLDRTLPLHWKVRRAFGFERTSWWRRWAMEEVAWDPRPPIFVPWRWLAHLLARLES